MVTQLGWEPLQVRRVKIRLLLLFKTQHNLVAIPAEAYLLPSDSRTRGQNTFRIPSTRKDVYRNSFFPRSIREWNNLPSAATTSSSVDEFRDTLGNLPALILTFSWRKWNTNTSVNQCTMYHSWLDPSPVSTSAPWILHVWFHHQSQPVYREFFMFGPITSLNHCTMYPSWLDPSTVSVERLQCNHLIGVELVWFAITCISARCEILPHNKIGPLHADLNSRIVNINVRLSQRDNRECTPRATGN